MREHPGGCSLTLQEEFVAIDFSQFKADSKKENEGVWIPVGPDSRVKIIRLSSRRFRDAQKEKMLPYENIQRLNVLKDEQQEILLAELVGETVILDWEGFTENGSVCPFSSENAVRVCKENRDFLMFIVEQASSLDNFRPPKEQSEKN
jgi:hypothetical protein